MSRRITMSRFSLPFDRFLLFFTVIIFAFFSFPFAVAKEDSTSSGGDPSDVSNVTVTETAPADLSIPAFRFDIDAALAGERIGNKLSNVNLWSFQTLTPPTEEDRSEGADLTPFVEFLQFMQATGSSKARDLFQDPENADVLDDYDFEPLYKGCETAISLGAKPHIKFSVPLKFSVNGQNGDFGTNVFPPDDYEVYYAFVRALAHGLVERFGREEVRQWRFGVLTEFENKGWFQARSGDPDESREAYFKLYDYTVEALIQEIGSDVFVGAHAMSCSEGLWDERDLLTHCARGMNYKTGRIGTRICFMATSYYDYHPGKPNALTLPEVVAPLRTRAEEVGLDNLIYGVDEGRMLYGVHKGKGSADLFLRIVGRTYQAAFDARILKQMTDAAIDYFSAWSYSTGNPYHGIPTVSYHVARQFSEFRDAARVPVHKRFLTDEGGEEKTEEGVEVDAVAGFDAKAGLMRVMAYHFKDDYDYMGRARAEFHLRVPEFAGKRVRVTRRVIDDRVNFFTEWEKDREKFGFDDSCFTWSPDDPGIDSTTTLTDPKAREIYLKDLRPRYLEISRLTPTISETEVASDGTFRLDADLDHHAVIFFEIEESAQDSAE